MRYGRARNDEALYRQLVRERFSPGRTVIPTPPPVESRPGFSLSTKADASGSRGTTSPRFGAKLDAASSGPLARLWRWLWA